MKNYSEMSDKRINVGVAFHLGLSTVILAGNGQFDPCNNPSDAWPILIEHFISIDMIGEGSNKIATGYSDKGKHLAKDFNPLRAAMIVFLMMKDAESEPIRT